MASTLSAVTLRKIDSRRERVERTNTESLRCVGDVVVPLRCLAVGRVRGRERMWCGEQDGTIVIRHVRSGATVATVPRRAAHIFPFSIQPTARGDVWIGYSDGTIAIMDANTIVTKDEFRAHGAAVTAMTVVRMPSDNANLEHHMEVVLSGSADWTLMKWDSSTGQCIGRLTGHGNTIRCIAALNSGIFMYSGSDDGSLRMWSLTMNEEVIEGSWPYKRLHRGEAVTAVVNVRDELLVTAGMDGVVMVLQSGVEGTLLRELEYRDAPLLSLYYDSICNRVWVGGADGILSLYEMVQPFFSPIAAVHDHSGAYIAEIRATQPHIYKRLFILEADGSGLRCFSGGNPSYLEALSTVGHDLDASRTMVVSSYNDLQQLRAQLLDAERRDKRLRSSAAGVLGGKSYSLIPAHVAHLRRFAACARRARGQAAMLRQAEIFSLRRSMHRSYGKWLRLALWCTSARATQRIARVGLARRNRNAQFRIAQCLLRAAEARANQRFMAVVYKELTLAERRKSLYEFYHRWRRATRVRRLAGAPDVVARRMLARVRERIVGVSWQRLHMRAATIYRKRNVQNVAMTMLVTRTSTFLRRTYFRRWVRSAVGAMRRHAHACTGTMGLSLEEALKWEVHPAIAWARIFWQEWQRRTRTHAQRRRSEELLAPIAELTTWTETLEEVKDADPAEIDEAIQLLEETLHEDEERHANLAAIVDRQQAEVRVLRRNETLNDLCVDVAAPPAVVASAVLTFLRRRGYNAHSDTPTPIDARGATRRRSDGGGDGRGGKGEPASAVALALRALHARLLVGLRAAGAPAPARRAGVADWAIDDADIGRLRRRDFRDAAAAARVVLATADAGGAGGGGGGNAALPDDAAREISANAAVLVALAARPLAPLSRRTSEPSTPRRSDPPTPRRTPAPSPRASLRGSFAAPGGSFALGGSFASVASRRSSTGLAQRKSPGSGRSFDSPSRGSARPATPRERAFLGMRIAAVQETMTVQDVTEYHPEKEGVMAPAWAAGLRVGDVLVDVGGKSPRGIDEFNGLVKGMKVGSEVTVTYRRDGEIHEAKVVVGGAVAPKRSSTPR